MTTTANAVRKLEKAGGRVTQTDPRHYSANFPAATVEINDQDGEAIIIYVKKHGAQDDPLTDYSAGHFVKTTKAAIELARRMESW